VAAQLTFDLPGRAALGRDNYFVSQANMAAVKTVDGWADWPDGKLVLYGPAGSGKTHLVHVWAADADAQVVAASALANADIAAIVAKSNRIAVEDVPAVAGNTAAETALFHLHNLALAEGGRLLLTGQDAPTSWPLTLPDLKSRVQATGLAQLYPPDDALLCAVLVKLFADRQVEVAPHAIAYLAPRIERSFAAAGRVVAALDTLALAEKRAITQPLAKKLLDSISAGAA